MLYYQKTIILPFKNPHQTNLRRNSTQTEGKLAFVYVVVIVKRRNAEERHHVTIYEKS